MAKAYWVAHVDVTEPEGYKQGNRVKKFVTRG